MQNSQENTCVGAFLISLQPTVFSERDSETGTFL